MPLFDRHPNLPNISLDLIDTANLIYEQLKSRKVAEIVLAEPETGLVVPNLVRSYLQAHLRRCLTFAEAGAAEITAGRPLVAEMCSRALYENVATICDFADKLKPLCDAVDYEGVKNYVSNAAFITRIPAFLAAHGDQIKAPQILNLIDDMAKRHPNYRTTYDHLSDIVHPNGLGAVVYFTRVEPGITRFADDAITPNSTRASIISATLLLLFVEVALTQTEERLVKLSADVMAGR
jgi:hypothetical protein